MKDSLEAVLSEGVKVTKIEKIALSMKRLKRFELIVVIVNLESIKLY